MMVTSNSLRMVWRTAKNRLWVEGLCEECVIVKKEGHRGFKRGTVFADIGFSVTGEG